MSTMTAMAIMSMGLEVVSTALASSQIIPLLAPVNTREHAAYNRWQQIKQYLHTIDDIKRIAERRGVVKLYHGCPTEFAELFIKYGPRVPYAVEDTARYVARLYGIPWVEFREYAYRKHEVVQRLSTAPAAIACRWAWSFPLGEVLTDLNSHARMFTRFKEISRERGISLDDAYNELYEQAIQVAHNKGIQCTTESAPGILGIPDKLALKSKTGALIQIDVDARALPEYAVRSAKHCIKDIQEGYRTTDHAVLLWNHEYRDIKVAAENAKSSRIVIRDMHPWEEELVENFIKKEIKEEV